MPDISVQESRTRDVPYRTGSGNWVYLPEDSARHHPLYGVYAWALLLLAFLVLGPIILVYQDVRILVSEPLRPGTFWIVLAADAIFLAAAWKAAARLGRESADFSGYFYIAAVLGLCAAALYLAILIEAGPRELDRLALTGFVWRAVPILLWTLYVLRSRRINVTTRKRVPSEDPFLRAQWLSEHGPGQVRPTRVVRHPPASPNGLQEESSGGGRRGAIRESLRRPRLRVPTQRPEPDQRVEELEGETVVVHRAASPRPRARPAGAALETYSPRRPVRSIAGALEPYSPRRSLMSRPQSEDTEDRLPPALQIGAPDPARLKRLQETEILDRLRQLQIAREEGLVTAAEERAKRQELLKEL